MMLMQKHALLTLLGLILAALAEAVVWLRPNAIGGTAFVVVRNSAGGPPAPINGWHN
jgi:hypothetical protein